MFSYRLFLSMRETETSFITLLRIRYLWYQKVPFLYTLDAMMETYEDQKQILAGCLLDYHQKKNNNNRLYRNLVRVDSWRFKKYVG